MGEGKGDIQARLQGDDRLICNNITTTHNDRASLIAQLVKNPPAMQETLVHIPGLGRSAGEGIGYPRQYSWASLVARLVKN